MSRFADVDAITIDGYGTLLELDDPIGHLDRGLRSRGVDLPREAIERGFRAEAAYYKAHNHEASDGETIERLYAGCAGAFLDAVGVALDPADFARVFPYEYRPLPGALETVRALAARGLALAVVANWDYGVREQLRRHRLEEHFQAVVVSAEIGARKPDAEPFRVALGRLGVASGRAVHVGDDESDERGAAAAGLAFRPAPLATAFEGWT